MGIEKGEAKLRNPGGETHAEFDRDVNLRGVLWTGVGLALVMVAAFVVSWFFFQGLAASGERRAPEPLPIPEAAERALPPGPRLQATPEEDLEDMLAQEEALLEGYSLVEEEGEHARIPIERALELVLERGLGPSGEGGPRSGAEGMIPEAADVDRAGNPPGGPPAAESTEGRDAQ